MATAETVPITDTRQRLIEAAIEVFLEHGYARTRVQDIARAAGMTTGAMYAHFDNKAALLTEAIATYGDSAIGDVLDAMVGQRADGSRGIAAGVAMLSGPPSEAHRLMLEALAVSSRRDEAEDLISPSLDRVREMFTESVAAAREAGLLDDSIDDETLVSLFERVFLGSIVAKALDLPGSGREQSEHLVATLLVSLVPH
jgi:AcrR family transcriptional regulator